MFVDALESLYLVMQLYENGLSRHFPVHAIPLLALRTSFIDLHALFFEQALTLRPDCASSIQSLKLYADEVHYLLALCRHKEVVNAAAGYRYLRHNMKLITGFVESEQMDAVGEYLAAF